MTKFTIAVLMALSLLGFLTAGSAQARGNDDPPECQVEDGGVLVCK